MRNAVRSTQHTMTDHIDARIGRSTVDDDLCLTVDKSGSQRAMRLENLGDQVERIGELTVAELDMDALGLSSDRKVYGEGFQMFAQYEGTLGNISQVGHSSDDFYPLSRRDDSEALYNVMVIERGIEDFMLLGFSSCRRFANVFRVSVRTIEVVLLLEDTDVSPGESVDLEYFFAATGNDREILLEEFSDAIGSHHPAQRFSPTPHGWCSWYGYYATVSQDDIIENVEVLAPRRDRFTYVQIDDGYQSAWGDWLTPNDKFPRGVKVLCDEVRSQGFEAAIWTAPFLAGHDSELFLQQPDPTA